MAVNELTATQNPVGLFRHYVLTNLSYWQDFVAARLKDTTALDRDHPQIVRAISFALELDDAWPAVEGLIEEFAAYMERRGYWEAWQWILTKALAVAQRSDDKASVVRLSALLARLALRQSRFKEAITYHRSTIHIARRIGDRTNEARACSNLGYFYIEQGYWRRAETLCCHALLIFEQLGHQHGLAHTENHLGILYTRQGLWEQARQHLEHACAIWQAMRDEHGLVYGYDNLGRLLNEMELPDEALPYLQQALNQAKLVGEEALTGSIHLNMGNAFKLKGELGKAESHYWQAKTIFQRFTNSLGLALTLDNLGLIYLDQKKWQEASLHLENALHAWCDLNNKHNEIRSITYLVEYELLRGNQRQASNWLEKAEQLLSQYDSTGEYHQLQLQVNKLRHNLSGDFPGQVAAK